MSADGLSSVAGIAGTLLCSLSVCGPCQELLPLETEGLEACPPSGDDGWMPGEADQPAPSPSP